VRWLGLAWLDIVEEKEEEERRCRED